MNPREKKLAMIVGGGLLLVILYNIVNFVFVKPIQKANEDIANLEQTESELDMLIQSRESLATRWMKYTQRTFSFDGTKAQDFFSKDLKELATRHGFDDALFSSSGRTSIGYKTDITTVAQKISVTGDYKKVMDLLLDIYRQPYLSQITKLSMSATGEKGERNQVKCEFIIETPLLPQISKKKIWEVANAETMPMDSEEKLDPYRKGLLDDSNFAFFSKRNILRPYMPPPANVVLIDNQDWEVAFVKVQFYFDGDLMDEVVETVPKKQQKSISGKGDVAVVQGTYKDSTIFGPRKLDFNRKRDWMYSISVHSEAPPPTEVDLAIDNQHEETVDIDVVVTMEDGKQKTLPTMRINAKSRQTVDQYQNIKTVQVTAKYPSGKQAASKTFKPATGQQVLTVQQETDAQPVRTADRRDPPADGKLTVTGLVIYPEPVTEIEEGELPEMVQEMIASGAGQRKIFRLGEEGEVDGGTLVAIHPLGGIVKMRSGAFYVYPLGEKFTSRVKLEAKDESELTAALDKWCSQ